MWSGEALSDRELRLLQAISEMVCASGLPALICGDFQNARAELFEVQCLFSAWLEFASGDLLPTYVGSVPRPIDHCLVSVAF